jgi:YVTN family beta-propeller protein
VPANGARQQPVGHPPPPLAGSAPPPPPPAGGAPPPPPGVAVGAAAQPDGHAAAAHGFPTTRQLIATGVAAAVIVAGVGTYLLRTGASSAAPPPASQSGPVVAVVHNGAAVLVPESLTGGAPGRPISVPGSPSSIVTTPDGTRAFLLNSSDAQIIPVDLAHAKVGTPFAAGKLPTTEALSADGNSLYVVDNLSHALITFNTVSGMARPAQQLPQGVDSFTPAPAGSSGVVSFFTAEANPGIIAFDSPAAGLGSAIGVGLNTPVDVRYSPDGRTVWVTEPGTGSAPGLVFPVDVRSQTVGHPITVGHGPAGTAMSPDGHLLVVTNSIDRSVTLVDLVARAVVATVPVGAGPDHAAITADGATAWIACTLDQTLVPVNLRARTAGAPLPLNNAPSDMSLPKSGGAWVLFASTPGTVTVLNGLAGSGTSVVPVGNQPTMLIARDSSTAWVANSLSNSVQHVDLAGRRAGDPIHVAGTPEELALTPDHRTLLVLSFGDGTHPGFLTAIDTVSSKASFGIPVGTAPSSLTLAPDGSAAFVANHQSNDITTVDVKQWRPGRILPLPCSPDQLVITPDGATLYAACPSDTAVLAVNTRSGAVSAAIRVGSSPSMVMGNTGTNLYVLENHQIQEILVSSNAIVLTHAETGNIVGMAPTPDDSTLVAVENTGGQLLLLSTATLDTTRSVAVGSRPQRAALTPDGLRAYVLDTSQQRLYIVDVAAGKVAATLSVAPNAAYVVTPSRQP